MSTLPTFRSKRLIKYKIYITVLIALFVAMTLVPMPARGDQIQSTKQEEKTQETAILPHPQPIPDRTTKRVVPVEEKRMIAALISDAFPDAPIMVAIANAEAGFDCGIKNPGSSARGCFQIVGSTWKDAKCVGDILDPKANIACARKLYDANGVSPWNESRYSWGKYTQSSLQHILQALGI